MEQIRQMFAGYRLKLTTNAARWLCKLAHIADHGALRACVHIMDYAVFLAKMQNTSTVDVPLLQQAAQSTLERASIMLKALDKSDSTTNAVAVA